MRELVSDLREEEQEVDFGISLCMAGKALKD